MAWCWWAMAERQDASAGSLAPGLRRTARHGGAASSEAPDRLLAAGALAIDNAPGEALDERALFHLLNLTRQTGGHVLIASETDPAQWKVQLPDLASRLKALAVARLDPPDDALLQGRAGEALRRPPDRGRGAGDFLPDAAHAALARCGPRRGRRTRLRWRWPRRSAVTRALAARVLQQMTEPGLFPEE